jgi:hypothetical protein
MIVQLFKRMHSCSKYNKCLLVANLLRLSKYNTLSRKNEKNRILYFRLSEHFPLKEEFETES